MALNASGPISLAGATAGQSIALELGLGTTTQISLNDTAVRTLAGVPTGAIVMPTNFWGKSNFKPTQKAIFGFGNPSYSVPVSTTNLVSNTGVVATNTAGVGSARSALAAAGYGGDKAIFSYGADDWSFYLTTNLVSNTGVVATDTAGVGTDRSALAAAGYGGDKAIFGFGYTTNTNVSTTNKVSNTGVVASDTAGVGTARYGLAAAGYGGDKAIFGFGLKVVGYGGAYVSMTNLVSNTGVVATDTTGVGSTRYALAAAGYGGDKAIFGFGEGPMNATAITNKVSNTGVVAADTAGVGTARLGLAAAGYSLT
jgi:hypothetical protein